MLSIIHKSGKHSYLIIKGISTPRGCLTHRPPRFTIGPLPRPASAAERAVEGPKPCFLVSCQLIFTMKVNKDPLSIIFFNPRMASTTSEKKKETPKKKNYR